MCRDIVEALRDHVDNCGSHLLRTEKFSLRSLLRFYELALSRAASDGDTTCQFDWWTFIFVDETRNFFTGRRLALGEMRVAAVPTPNQTRNPRRSTPNRQDENRPPPTTAQARVEPPTTVVSSFWDSAGFSI
jgi:hypothetical protein